MYHSFDLGAIIKFKPEITFTTNRTYANGKSAPDGIEIRFGSVRPVWEVRDTLKKHGFKFSDRQKMWYAKATPKAKEFAETLLNNEVFADDTQYEKRNFWAKVKSYKEFEEFQNRTEFMIKGTPPQFFFSKPQLLKSKNIKSLISDDLLYFKKYYNKVVGEDEDIENEENEQEENETQQEQEQKSTNENLKIAEKLEELADGMQKTIDQKYNSATSKQRPTAKRLRVAESMREDGRKLKQIQNFLYALSNCRKNNNIQTFGNLKNIKTKAQAELIQVTQQMIENGWSDNSLETHYKSNKEAYNRLGISSLYDLKQTIDDKVVLMNIHANKNKEIDETERKIKKLEIEIIQRKIPGFFPTPTELIAQLFRYANVSDNDLILEPSAGKGDILDYLAFKRNSKENLHAVEINPTLREMLKLKGYNVVANDFLSYNPSFKYDKIIMNPPFEKGLDIDHVNHALTMLKPNGILVSIMGEGTFFRSFNKEKVFREKLDQMGAFVSPTIKDAFKSAFNSTGVSVRIVQIKMSENNIESEVDEMELLELEAQAEIELLKMRIELQKKKQNKGLNGIDQIKLRQLRHKAWMFNTRNDIPDFY
jgi:hypothetical protein